MASVNVVKLTLKELRDRVLIWAEGAEMISSQRVASLLHEFLKSPNEITLPSRAGARVLPVIFPLWVVDELRSGSPQTSLQKFLQLHPERVAEVPLDEHDFVIQSSQITASESGIMDDGR